MGDISLIKPKNLSFSEWNHQREEHIKRISNIISGYLRDRNRQKKNPILDFLFEYYSFRPGKLLRWSPGFGILLEGNNSTNFYDLAGFMQSRNEITLDIRLFPKQRIDSLRWLINLLTTVSLESPSFACFGMHEWAMVYQTDDIRHSYLPLRFSKSEINQLVESRPIICTHYDAFRFFTVNAQPLNKIQPSRKNLLQMEQPGCLHVNMDLYKWAYKFYPWTPSNLIADAFELAVEARTIDMQASPYDLSTMGLEPIKIETPEGREIYKSRQQEVWLRGKPIRKKLIKHYTSLLNEITNHQ